MTGTADTRHETGNNADPDELAHFSRLAADWWNPTGDSKPLHDINPLRLAWIRQQAGGLDGRRVADIGCGGGILSEAMATEGARVVGVDLSTDALEAARAHLATSGLTVDYRETGAEALAESEPGGFDVVTCMELLEHVPDPASVVDACARLLAPGGTVVWSTINRTPKAWLLAIVGAEYLLGLLPRGTHAHDRFIRPSELAAWNRAAGLDVRSTTGIAYNPLAGICRLDAGTDVNYMMAADRPHGTDD